MRRKTVWMLALLVLVGIITVLAAGCVGSTTATSGTMMGNTTASGMMYGTTATTMVASTTPISVTNGGSTGSTLGERIYLTATDENGRPIPRSTGTGMMGGGVTCADCHGTDGRGRTVSMMMSSFTSSDIRWSTLTSPTDPDGQPQTPFTEASFAHALRNGIDPEGASLKAPMPLWDVTDAEVRALMQYLRVRGRLGRTWCDRRCPQPVPA